MQATVTEKCHTNTTDVLHQSHISATIRPLYIHSSATPVSHQCICQYQKRAEQRKQQEHKLCFPMPGCYPTSLFQFPCQGVILQVCSNSHYRVLSYKFVIIPMPGCYHRNLFQFPYQGVIKEDIGIEQQLNEIARGKNFALNFLS